MDFKCSGDNLEQIPEEVVRETGITFPEAHTDGEKMAVLAAALRSDRGDIFTRVPFCVTVEAEALGAKIKLGNAKSGPRVEEYAFNTLEEMAGLKPFELIGGRIEEVLKSVEILAGKGETVALSLEGPFTIVASLIDPMEFYKGLRNYPELAREILGAIEEGIVSYGLEGIKRGAKVLSYGDPVGGMDIVGPKVYREYSSPVTCRILSRLAEADENVLIHLCGKTSTALQKLELAEVQEIDAAGAETYGEALTAVMEKSEGPVMVGHRCIKWSSKKMGQPVVYGIKLN